MDKNQREARRRQEDIALNRALAWVGAAIVLELFLLLINRFYINYVTTQESVALAMKLLTLLRALRVVALVGAVAAAAWLVVSLKKAARGTLPLLVMLGCAAVSFCSHISVAYNDVGVRMLFLLVPAWAALAVIYYLYQREFFFCGVISGFGVVALWLIRHWGTSPATEYGFLVACALVLVIGAVVLLRARGNGGVFPLGPTELHVLPRSANYLPILITAVLNLAMVILALVMGGTMAYYLIYVLVAWLFALLVYHTVKMM